MNSGNATKSSARSSTGSHGSGALAASDQPVIQPTTFRPPRQSAADSSGPKRSPTPSDSDAATRPDASSGEIVAAKRTKRRPTTSDSPTPTTRKASSRAG